MDLATRDHGQRSGLVEWMAMTVDCPEPNIMVDFYAALLGGTVTRLSPGGAKVEAAGRLIYFRAAPGYRPPTWPSAEVPLHAHFDYVVEDPHVAAEQLVALGASLGAHQNPDDPDLLVMLDPAGHPFCLIRSSAAGAY
jgi:glyoxalase superfamily protein